MAQILFDPNTGQRLNPGQTVNFQGYSYTQGNQMGSQTLMQPAQVAPIMSQQQTLQQQIQNTQQQLTNANAAGYGQGGQFAGQQIPQAIMNQPAPVQQPATITASNLNTVQSIALAPAVAPLVSSNYITSATTDSQNARQKLEGTYTKQLNDFKIQADDAQKRIDELNAASQGIMDTDVKVLMEPFRQKLEESERQRLSVEKNFEENQKLVGELDTLLTDGNQLIQQMQGVTGLSGIRNPRINEAIQGVNARVGVIQAVMAARNGQITQAGNLIDRSVDAITADRKDQLGYYNSLINFNETLKDDEGKKLINLTNNQKDILNAQMRLLENDVLRIEKNADAIRNAMTNPETATAYAQSGVTLQDSPEQIAQKLDRWASTNPDIRSVDGGLYDIVNKKWVVRKGEAVAGTFIENPTTSGTRTTGTTGVRTTTPSPTSTTPVAALDPTVAAWVSQINAKKATISNVPANLKNAVVQALSSQRPSDTGLESPEVEILTNKLELINSLITHKGLNSSVGPVYGARIAFADKFGAKADFGAGVHQLVNKETIDTLINLKARGGTLGALSDQERILLQSAATKIGSWEIPDDKGFPSGEFKIDEKSFIRELEQIKKLTQKALERAGGGALRSEDLSELDILYESAEEQNPANYYE